MLFQRDNYGFSAPVVFRGKAQRAGNGYSLSKRCNAAAGHHGGALRVSLSASMDIVASLDKGTAIACEARLAMNADKLTEPAIITLKEH
ncbi:MAG: hypothetical protein JMN24_17010 [gamma proteobacterium endosymbiont of Lamellibrachia anaximandri]|nr:hypothetical protein [gamma proteobacterium endosymbiont of Lamellibrachia anaximandri]MBL3619228.1 hypothetical protein [gamma proteobacterium endosymbiont of Lamellibrachia anaximandri]